MKSLKKRNKKTNDRTDRWVIQEMNDTAAIGSSFTSDLDKESES